MSGFESVRRLQDQFDREALARRVEPISRCAKDISPRELEPLWPNVLWIGKPTLLVGDPGLGKSLVTVDIAARVSRGTPWPCETAEHDAADVLILSAEDDPDDTIVPRLMAAGADLERITFLEAVRQYDREGRPQDAAVSLDQHIEVLRSEISKRTARLVIIDPIAAFLGATDSHVNSEVRALLAALGRLATELRIAILVVSHLNKANGSSAVYRITGSLAFVAAARAVFAIAKDPEKSERRLMLPIKSNLGPDTLGYAYTVKVADNDAPCVGWEDERVTQTAEEILTGTPSPREQAVIERGAEVATWLREPLQTEPQPAASIYTAAEREGISERDLKRAQARPRGNGLAYGLSRFVALVAPWLEAREDTVRSPKLDACPTLYRCPTLSDSEKSGAPEFPDSDRLGLIWTLGQSLQKCPTLEQLHDLSRRVDALERAQRRHRNGLDGYNARRAAAAKELRQAIRAILASAPKPDRLTAKHVIRALDPVALGYPHLSLRTVRHHLAAIRRRY